MARKMSRGKQQLLLNYLPGKTFDFQKIGTIARISHVRGVARGDLNAQLILKAIDDQVGAWSEEFRPVFRGLDAAADRFVLVEPKGAEAEMFPLVFWCQRAGCGAVVSGRIGVPASENCPRCNIGRLVQLRFVRVHRCGALEALDGETCNQCNGRMSLDTRGSERISNFQWVCRTCSRTASVFAGRCRSCNWPGTDQTLKNMSVEVHRARRTFYPHFAVLLNQPSRELSAFLAMPQWPALAAGVFFGISELAGKRLVDLGRGQPAPETGFRLTDTERERLRSQGTPDDLIAQFERMQAQLRDSRSESAAAGSPDAIAEALVASSGVPLDVWNRAGQEMLEAVIPLQTSSVVHLSSESGRLDAKDAARRLGLASVAAVADFPITTATFGYSRVDYQPDACRLNPFPPDPDQGGKFPIFVDVIQADAILLRLDHEKVLQWMQANGLNPAIPNGKDPKLAARSYFVNLFDGVPLRHTLGLDHVEARYAFGLLHTLAHLSVRRASLLCGLDGTSLSEYMLPKTLTWALYCNHRFGATIGALTALFEQSLMEWLTDVRSTRRCVYDPVCAASGGSCHACSHLAETSCRFFNLNLGRSFLFGGSDPVVGEIKTGFLDFVVRQ